MLTTFMFQSSENFTAFPTEYMSTDVVSDCGHQITIDFQLNIQFFKIIREQWIPANGSARVLCIDLNSSLIDLNGTVTSKIILPRIFRSNKSPMQMQNADSNLCANFIFFFYSRLDL